MAHSLFSVSVGIKLKTITQAGEAGQRYIEIEF